MKSDHSSTVLKIFLELTPHSEKKFKSSQWLLKPSSIGPVQPNLLPNLDPAILASMMVLLAHSSLGAFALPFLNL